MSWTQTQRRGTMAERSLAMHRVIFATLAALWSVNFIGVAVTTNLAAGTSYVKVVLPVLMLSAACGAVFGGERRYDFGKLHRQREGRRVEKDSDGAEEAAGETGQRKGKPADEDQVG